MKHLIFSIYFNGLFYLRIFILGYNTVCTKNCQPNPPKCRYDTCPFNGYSELELQFYSERNCYCDHDCELYGDCCSNIEQRIHISLQKGLTACVRNPLNGFNNIFMIIKCPSYWNDGDIRWGCEQQNGTSIDNVPVTSEETKRTYKNLNCAKCNNDEKNLIYWNINFDCPLVGPGYKYKDFLQVLEMNILQHDNIRQQWYLAINQTKIPCTVRLTTTASILRPCIQAISTCAKNWIDPIVKIHCQMYTAYRFSKFDERAYKNYDCAKCNYNSQPLLCNSNQNLVNLVPNPPGFQGLGGSDFSRPCSAYNCMYKPNIPGICNRGYAWSKKRGICITCDPFEIFNGVECVPGD